MITKEQIIKTYTEIKKDIFKTPLVYSPVLSEISGGTVFLKMEHLQLTGSFKIRGVLSKLSSLAKSDFDKVFVAASTGNHAAAFGYAAKEFGFKGVLFLPEKTSETKVKAIEQYDLDIRFYGANSRETEAKARAYANEINGVLIHPYNDLHIIKGQATIGVEIKEQLPDVDSILVPVGGGGLTAGLCSYFKNTENKIIGCQPINGAEMYESIEQNRIVSPSTLPTISDATSGGIEEKAMTFDICKKELFGFELLDENSIKQAVAFAIKYHQTLIEPASALPIAAILNSKKYQGQKVVLILTGKKIDVELLKNIIIEHGNDY